MSISHLFNRPISSVTRICNAAIAAVTLVCNVVKGGGASVAFDNVSAQTVGEEVATLETPSWTLGSGAAVLSFALALGSDDAVPSTFKIGGSGGADLTLAGTTLTMEGAIDYATARLAGIANRNAGGTTSYAAWGGTPPQFSSVTSMSFTGAHASAPFGAPVSESGLFDETGGGDASVTLATTPGRTVAAFLYLVGSQTPTYDDNDASPRASHALVALGFVHAVTQVALGASTTVTIGVTLEPGGSAFWEIVAVELIPAG
jgi:hypothetical protein